MKKLEKYKLLNPEEIGFDEKKSIIGGDSWFWDASINQWLYCPGEVVVVGESESNQWYWGPGSSLTPSNDGSQYDPYYGYGGYIGEVENEVSDPMFNFDAYYENLFLNTNPYDVNQIPADDSMGGVTIPISYFHQSNDLSDSTVLSLPVGLTQYQVDLALSILGNPNIIPATIHVETQFDGASAFDNLTAIANGDLASTSPTGDAQGTCVALSYGLLYGIETLGQCFTFSISELAGADHETNSGHYEGTCMDVNVVNGVRVRYMSEGAVNAFRNAAFAAGAIEVLDPYHDTTGGGHSNHFHIQFN